MNVSMAFQFFGAADAMQLFENECLELKDSSSSHLFSRRITEVIKAMNSRTPFNAWKLNNQQFKAVKDFITYVKFWETEAKNQQCYFLSKSTCDGLKISLKGTLHFVEYLIKDINFEYVMTTRLNQDALENFFGIMRNACGSNDHPDSTAFLQMYNLISTYSLIKPPRGSNADNAETLPVLLAISNMCNKNERKLQWEAKLDTIIQKGSDISVLPDAMRILQEHGYFEDKIEDKSSQDHNYHVHRTSEYVLAYMAGFIARKGQKFAKFRVPNEPCNILCDECVASLQLSQSDVMTDSHALIEIKSMGKLLYPSKDLQLLLSIVEDAILSTVCAQPLDGLLFDITTTLEKVGPLPLIGCPKHTDALTGSILRYYLIMRMQFVCKQYNKNENMAREQTRERRKLAKLSTPASSEPKDQYFSNGINPEANEKDSEKTNKRKQKESNTSQIIGVKRKKESHQYNSV